MLLLLVLEMLEVLVVLVVTELFTSSLLQTSHVGLLYQWTIPDYGQERET